MYQTKEQGCQIPERQRECGPTTATTRRPPSIRVGSRDILVDRTFHSSSWSGTVHSRVRRFEPWKQEVA